MRVHERFPQGIQLYTDFVDLIPTMRWQASKLRHGTWEPETFAILDSLIHRDTVLLDIGAWIGVLTLFGAARAKRVVAYEPDPNAFEALTDNVALNACTNVICAPTAIGAQDGPVLLGGSPIDGRFGCSTSQVCQSDSSITNCLQVPAIRLDSAVDRLGLTNDERLFIKMDIEGGEFFAIPASQEVWKRKPQPILLLSLHGKLQPLPEMTHRVVSHLADYYGSDTVRIVTWDSDAGQARLLPLKSRVASDSMESLLFASSSDLERMARAL